MSTISTTSSFQDPQVTLCMEGGSYAIGHPMFTRRRASRFSQGVDKALCDKALPSCVYPGHAVCSLVCRPGSGSGSCALPSVGLKTPFGVPVLPRLAVCCLISQSTECEKSLPGLPRSASERGPKAQRASPSRLRPIANSLRADASSLFPHPRVPGLPQLRPSLVRSTSALPPRRLSPNTKPAAISFRSGLPNSPLSLSYFIL